jgi:hypothetical protein
MLTVILIKNVECSFFRPSIIALPAAEQTHVVLEIDLRRICVYYMG